MKFSEILISNLGWVVEFLSCFKAEVEGFTLIFDRLELFFAFRVSIDHLSIPHPPVTEHEGDREDTPSQIRVL